MKNRCLSLYLSVINTHFSLANVDIIWSEKIWIYKWSWYCKGICHVLFRAAQLLFLGGNHSYISSCCPDDAYLNITLTPHVLIVSPLQATGISTEHITLKWSIIVPYAHLLHHTYLTPSLLHFTVQLLQDLWEQSWLSRKC